MDLLCGICGTNHKSSDCNFITINFHILDTPVPSRAYLSLPDALEIQTMADGAVAVLVKRLIPKGTKFGPFVAKKILTLNPCTLFPIKIFTCDEEDLSEYYLDTTNENECNWMIFIRPAESIEDQNLICYQDSHDIYFVSLRDIEPGEQLRVWYSQQYGAKMKAKPLLSKKTKTKDFVNLDLSKLVTNQQNITPRENWSCKFCGAVETSVVAFSTHILAHYVMQLKKVCEICHEAFGTRKGLKKHIRIVHCSSFGKSHPTNKTGCKEIETVQENLKRCDTVIGGPLLNDVLVDSLDNSSIMLQQTELDNFDLENQNILIESENLNVDNILNENVKDLEHFNFEIDETDERFICDICLKAFSKLRLLVQHLKKHTAKYICYKCSKVFCRNENLKAHICNNLALFKCPVCQKVFTQKKYLKRHIETKHTNNEKKKENIEGQSFSCIRCSKMFSRERYLNKHMKTHLSLPSKKKGMTFVCEVCGKHFDNKGSLKQHHTTHKERTFECNICGSKFNRRDIMNNHILTHSAPQFKCDVCGKVFKMKKNLKMHLQIHKSGRVYKCTECPKVFHIRSNMLKHQKHMHSKTCTICNKTFSSAELMDAHAMEHLGSYYVCKFCNKIIKLRSSLIRHLKKIHKRDVADMDINKIKTGSTKNKQKCGESTAPVKNVPVQVKHDLFEMNDFDDLATDFYVQDVNNQQVCLSIPDVQQRPEVTLGHNAYLVENKADVEPGELNKVVLYVLNQDFES